jgi:hypothetical protein
MFHINQILSLHLPFRADPGVWTTDGDGPPNRNLAWTPAETLPAEFRCTKTDMADNWPEKCC